MLQLAVATRAETYDRMADPLATRGIEVGHVDATEGAIPLSRGAGAIDTEGDVDPGDFDVGFVYPPRLAEGGVVDALLGVPWVNDRERVLRSRQKGETLARLDRAGVPTPETVVVSNPAGEAELTRTFEQFDPPVVVKPNATTRGIGVATAGDLDSFLGICDYLDLVHDYRATGDRSFLVQEYLADASDYRVMLIEGEFVGAVRRRLPADALEAGQWKHNVHRGAVATGVDPGPELRAIAERAARALDIPWLGVDLLVTEKRAVVNETNARPTIDSATKYDDGFWDDVADLIRARA